MVLPVLDNRNSNAASPTVEAVTIWQGTTTSYTTSSNWSNGVPVDGGIVYYATNNQDVADSNQKAVNLREFRVADSYGGTLGGGLLQISATTMVLASSRCVIGIRPFVEDLHIVAMPREMTIAEGRVNRLHIHTNTGVLTINRGTINKLVVSPGSSQVSISANVSTDNPLASAAGPFDVRLGRGSRATAAAPMNFVNASGSFESSATIANASANGRVGQIESSGSVITTLTLNGGELLLKDSDTNATLTIGNGTINGGRINGVDSNRRITNTNPMTVQGEIQVQLVSGQTITLA
tara:strand:- start:2 stop:883 length:882 start_codon:yes stop_codon:yes gene_type:complete